jgi:hypothetical protein
MGMKAQYDMERAAHSITPSAFMRTPALPETVAHWSLTSVLI